MIKPMADFMARFIDETTGLPHASYDLWEEKFLTTTYTTSIVIYALNKAAEMAIALGDKDEDVDRWRSAADTVERAFSKLFNEELGIYRKGMHRQADGTVEYDDTLDISSMYGPFIYGKEPLNNKWLLSTVRAVEEKLVNRLPAGGVIRHEDDWYMNNTNHQQPNPWYVCTMWMAQYYIQAGDVQRANDLTMWCLRHALPSGVFSEQIDPATGYAVGVAPLVWSHVEFINTILDLADATNN
jgi:GH15 family glucan-1,4-alpha-glucosidase